MKKLFGFLIGIISGLIVPAAFFIGGFFIESSAIVSVAVLSALIGGILHLLFRNKTEIFKFNFVIGYILGIVIITFFMASFRGDSFL